MAKKAILIVEWSFERCLFLKKDKKMLLLSNFLSLLSKFIHKSTRKLFTFSQKTHHTKILLIGTFFLTTCSFAENLNFPDFNDSLNRYGASQIIYNAFFRQKNKKKKIQECKENKELLENIYYSKTENLHKTSNPKIPKVIHQIWLGSSLPERYKEWVNSWKNIDGWTYKLWTDVDIENMDLQNKELYEKGKDYGEKSDILRYEILYKEGGLYVDIDFECLNPDWFNLLHHSFDFYAGIEPLEHSQPSLIAPSICNAIIGSAPKHPLLKKVIKELPKHYEKNEKKWAVITTGPIYLTKKIMHYLKKETNYHSFNGIILPSSFFYPMISPEMKKNFKKNYKKLVKSETAAIHYWSGSWKPKSKKKR